MPAVPHAAPTYLSVKIFSINELIPFWAPESRNAGHEIFGAYNFAALPHRPNDSNNGFLTIE